MEMKGPFKGEQGYYMSRERKLDWGNLHGRIYGGHKGNLIMNTPKLESWGHLGVKFQGCVYSRANRNPAAEFV